MNINTSNALSPINLYKFVFSFDDLKKATRQEQVFFIKALEISHEIISLHKFILYSNNAKGEKESVQESAQTMQHFIL